MLPLILIGLGIFAIFIVFGLLAGYLRLWLQSYASSAGIGLFDLVAPGVGGTLSSGRTGAAGGASADCR